MNSLDSDALLEAVVAANAAHDQDKRDAALHAAVHAAYNAGATVEAIADALGTHQPHVTRKYGPFERRPVKPVGDVDAALAGISEIVASEPATWKDLIDAVAAARNAGITWQAIADSLGRKQPNVIQQFRPHLQVATTVQPAPVPATRARLTAAQQAELIRRVKAGELVSALAAEFGASTSYVRGLRRRK